MARPKVFRDPVHGQIVYTRLPPGTSVEKNFSEAGLGWAVQGVIDSAEFQRLRHVRQNGLTNLVFHGAEHSRFSHSMGAAFLAREMYDRIVRNMDESRDDVARTTTCLAALLHDVGHGPFSHTLEEILGSSGVSFDHEVMTVRLVKEDTGINKVLSQVDAALAPSIAAYIDKEERDEHWKYLLVSSQLDADRLDYLRRDAQCAGIFGHGFDLPRLLENLHHVDGKRIAVHRKAVEAVEAYLIVLDQMYRAIYYHHTVRAASFLLSAVVRRAVSLFRDGKKWVMPKEHLFAGLCTEGDKIDIGRYVRLAEFHVWALVEEWSVQTKDKVLADLSQRLLRRALFKTIDVDPTNYEQTTSLVTKAKDLVKANIQFVDEETVDFYVGIDEPKRTSYKRYDWTSEEGSDESIFIIGAGKSIPVEEFTESKIVSALKETKFFHRLIFPSEIAETLRKEQSS